MECREDSFRGSTGGRSRNWANLAEKLSALVKMRGHWGDLHNIYETRSESLFDQQPLPPCVRDPESKFSLAWDIASALCLLFVCFVTPLRACFAVDIELWGWAFIVDLFIDAFFVADVLVNMRTSFYDHNGFRENRPKRIFIAYLKSWFFVDVISCIPFGYFQYLKEAEGANKTERSENQMRSLKTMRLLKLGKILRLGRLQRILQRYAEKSLRTFACILRVND
eukprot:SAG31_NODE_3704_length_3973_cov_2.604285_2_plen_224_part_00